LIRWSTVRFHHAPKSKNHYKNSHSSVVIGLATATTSAAFFPHLGQRPVGKVYRGLCRLVTVDLPKIDKVIVQIEL
jgi:hypothetical protein